MKNWTCKLQLWWEDFNSRKLGIPRNYEVSRGNPYVLDINNSFQVYVNCWPYLTSIGIVSFQEEQEARAKADKIKLALEKLKEAKIKKVSLKMVK